MTGLLAVYAWIALNVLAGVLAGWRRDGVAPWRRSFWQD